MDILSAKKIVIVGVLGRWVIDGNYPSFPEALRLRLERADVAIYLNFPYDVCIKNIRERGHANPDSMNGISTPELVEFLVDQVKNYTPKNEKIRAGVLAHAGGKYIEFNDIR